MSIHIFSSGDHRSDVRQDVAVFPLERIYLDHFLFRLSLTQKVIERERERERDFVSVHADPRSNERSIDMLAARKRPGRYRRVGLSLVKVHFTLITRERDASLVSYVRVYGTF